MQKQIDIITMGCSKNLVDSENLQRLFHDSGYKCVLDSEVVKGDVVVINTCGFIGDAKQESIDTILQFVQAKEEGQIKELYVMGCLSERYMKELEEEIPQVDKYYGKYDYKQLAKDIQSKRTIDCAKIEKLKRQNPHYCYIKISEGCNRHCAYCAIPIITGKHKSRPINDILDEVKQRVAEGVKEFQLIAQELTYYGIDIDGKRQIASLVSQMADIKGVEWIRLHYAYPNQFPEELLDVMNEKENVCKYLDIALQHISTSVLQRMRRNTTKEETEQLIQNIRSKVPGIALRTTLMVGYPGETEEEFQELLNFVKEAKFEMLGAFAYSEEEGTYSANHYEDNISEEVKQQRLSKLMRVQQSISADYMQSQVGNVMKVIIDRKEGDWYVGRSQYSSPEIDSEVLIPASEKTLKRGCFYNVRITGAEEFDLYATTSI